MYTCMCVGLVYCMCVCAYQAVYVCAGHKISGVSNRKCTQPFGCSPNWLCTVDRMLTEHIAQTGTLFLSVSSSMCVKKNTSSEEFPALLIFKHLKKTEVVPCDKLQSLLFFSCGEKGNGNAGERPALMRWFSASYWP